MERQGEFPATTILVPARNEEANIGPCVTSLRRQGGSSSLIVVDDGSTDRTAAIVSDLAADDPRIELVAAGDVPPAWRGKVHALSVGMDRVTTPWILTTDADTRHAPGLLARAHATAAHRHLDWISLAGQQEVQGVGENLLTPPVFAVLDAVLGNWTRAASGGATLANGQYILVRSAAIQAIGGFAAVRCVPIDDVALAVELKAAGFQGGFFRAPEELRIRMYQGFGASVRGWRRSLGALFGGRWTQALGVLLVLLGPSVLLGFELARREGPAALALWLGGAVTSMVLRRGSRHSPRWGLLYPLDALVLSGVLLLALRDYSRGFFAPWKGREMPVAAPSLTPEG
ncbi:MAG TPA: glycosyltransferase family A protein [Thermoanaerobaculia bacterium]|nr:glycosyltransferase family A protein [Thermoanaerobaculia bacterium]